MGTHDFTKFYRSSVGFDRVFDLLENANQLHAIENWPSYDIEKTADDCYRITMAVAGFAEDELQITQERNMLIVKGSKADSPTGELLHRGIANRSFRRRFELADYVTVRGATLENGLLTIDLARELPEELRPRQIPIRAALQGQPEPKQLEQQAA